MGICFLLFRLNGLFNLIAFWWSVKVAEGTIGESASSDPVIGTSLERLSSPWALLGIDVWASYENESFVNPTLLHARTYPRTAGTNTRSTAYQSSNLSAQTSSSTVYSVTSEKSFSSQV